MASIQVPATSAALTANGSAIGFATVASNAGFYPGCIGWIQNDNKSQRCLILSLSSTDKVYLKLLPEENQGYKFSSPQAGPSSLAAYTTLLNSKLYMDAQLAPVDPNYTKKLAAY